MKVGRFQVMATLQAARAHALGYPLDEAKSFGLSRAIFYAAAKRGFKKAAGTESHEAAVGEHGKVKGMAVETLPLGDEEAPGVQVDGKRRYVMGDDVLDAEDFDRQIAERFGGTFDRAWHEALQIVRKADRDVLTSRRRFYDDVYKPRRDVLAAQWSEQATRGKS
jgi:hypothetical protein